MSKEIFFCSHAENKFRIFKRHGLNFTKTQITEVLLRPEKIVDSDRFRKIAQKEFKPGYLLRVVFEETKESITVITFYPAKRSRYEY